MWDWLPWRRKPAAEPGPGRGSDGPVTLRYHEATAQTSARVQEQRAPVDWSQQPSLYKLYPPASRLSLLEHIDCNLPATLDVVDGLRTPGARLTPAAVSWTLEAISRLCYYAYGPTSQQEVPGTTLTLRAAPSAGALYPCELYVAVRGADGLANGLYHYAPGEHALARLRRGDWIANLAEAADELDALVDADAVFMVSSLWWRSAWKYGARAYRYCLQDAGHLAGNVALVAAAMGYRPTVVHGFADAPANRLLGLDGAREAAQVWVAVRGDLPYRPPRRGALLQPDEAPPQPVSGLLPAAGSLVTHTAAATCLPDSAAVRAWRGCAPATSPRPQNDEPTWLVHLPPTAAGAAGPSLCQSLLGRRSSHQFAPGALAADALGRVLRTLSTAYESDLPLGASPSLFDLYVIVNRVEHVPPGAYRYAAASHSLVVSRPGNLREWAMHLSLDQAFCGDAGAVIFLLAGLGALVRQCGDRMYRMAHVEAGLRGQAAYLAAHALGIGCTGIGAFYDLETIRFFDAAADAGVVYELALGSLPVDG